MTEVYRANDGTIFEDEDDCFVYEQMSELKDAGVYFADSSGKQITVEEIVTGTVNTEDITFIKCITYEDYEKMCNLFNELEIMCPEDWDDENTVDAQCWYLGEDEYHCDCWMNLRARIKELDKLKSICEKVLNA